MKLLSQRTRLVLMTIYVAALFFMSRLALGSWLPPTTEKGVWFYTGLAAILLGNLLVTPFFTKPVDTISYAVAALIAMSAINVWTLENRTGFDHFLWLGVLMYLAVLLVSGVLTIALKDSAGRTSQRIGSSLYVLTDTAGTPKLIFSAVFLFALVTFHRDNPREYVLIGASWVFFVGLQPLESMAGILARWWDIWRAKLAGTSLGEVVGHQAPGLVLVKHQHDCQISFGDTIVVRADDGGPGLALALDHVGFADGLWTRALHLSVSADVRDTLLRRFHREVPHGGAALRVDIGSIGVTLADNPTYRRMSALVGLVAPDTDLTRLRIEVVRADLDLQEGRLVEVEINGLPVLYQVINGVTREEILQQKNTRGYVRADAKKVGCWNQQRTAFDIVKWIPQPNVPVFLVETTTTRPNKDTVGHFPGTDCHVSVDVDPLVTHNTAILGILGSGKSFLAIELVERMIKAGIKVICLDLTNQYATELAPPYDTSEGEREIEQLQALGPPGKTMCRQNVEEGGSVLTFHGELRRKLFSFLAPENESTFLKVFNPAYFEVWRQDSKPFNNVASMVSLTPAEITRLFTEATLEVLQQQGMTDKARCCLVFEEAHSLIPEWTAIASEGDRAAANGTAKAILQGRKYGLGCLVITQRTANVTKSILNQCNTVFALRVFDATGMEFLKNYIGEDYTGVLSTLEDRHAVLFGRASSCRDPVMIRLNDRPDFLRVFRDAPGAQNVGGAQ